MNKALIIPSRILIVDDNESMRSILRTLLRHEGFEVVGELADGANLVCVTQQLVPDIVCLDYLMPGEDGLSALVKLRDALPEVAVLMITGSANPEIPGQAAAANVDGFLKKPFTQAQIVAEVSRVACARRQIKQVRGSGNAESSGQTMVISDDSARQLLATIAESMGVTVVAQASNGQEAIELVDKFKPDLLSLDVEMPVKNDIDALIDIRKRHPDLSVIMVTGLADRHVVQQAGQLGAREYLLKPYRSDQVIRLLKRLKA